MTEWWKIMLVWLIAYFIGLIAQGLQENHFFISVIIIIVGYLIWRILFDFWFL